MSKTETLNFRISSDDKKDILKKVEEYGFQDLTEMVLFLLKNVKIHCSVGVEKTLQNELGFLKTNLEMGFLTKFQYSKAVDILLEKYKND